MHSILSVHSVLPLHRVLPVHSILSLHSVLPLHSLLPLHSVLHSVTEFACNLTLWWAGGIERLLQTRGVARLWLHTCCAAGSTVAECCSLSCSSESRDANGPQLLPCVESQVLNDEPVSTIELAVADENDAPMDAWRIYRGCDNNGPGCDPRVLIALATMKTAGERFCFGFDCEYESHGFEHRIGVWLFGSGGWLMLATCFCACLFLCCQREDRSPTINHFEQVEDGVRLRDYEQADNTEH